MGVTVSQKRRAWYSPHKHRRDFVQGVSSRARGAFLANEPLSTFGPLHKVSNTDIRGGKTAYPEGATVGFFFHTSNTPR